MIKYEKGNWKYKLTEDYYYPMKLPSVLKNQWYSMDEKGITIYRGYMWDGPSGPTIDTTNTIRASLIHDTLYQAIQLEDLPASWRPKADKEFRKILKEDSVSFIRRWGWYYAVRSFGGAHIK